MNLLKALALFLLSSLLFFSCSESKKKVLVFSKTEGFVHSSIEVGIPAIEKLLDNEGISVDATEDATMITEDVLKTYAAVIFLNTTGDILNGEQEADFERYIQAGGGFVGIHAATDTEYDWPWYNQLVGAYFDNHPAIQEAKLKVLKPEDPTCQHLPETWTFTDEWYNFKSINPNIEVLVEMDESSYNGGTNGDQHPAVWKHNFDGGRAFYTTMGHQDATFSDPLFLEQLQAGVKFAIGNNSLDYSKARTQRLPEENRFSKEVLDFNLDEPMELDELGSEGIIFIERRGSVKLYEYETKQTKILDTIDVFYANEDGLLGVAVDPNYPAKPWVYFFYSPNVAESKQHVSRFTLSETGFTDEKVLLEIPTIRKCCHSGGSLEFGKDGLLYVGLGDNTNPFESSGYAPIDERPNRALFDAQRSAGNANDLRGGILRIQPEDDGTYSIPEGNLFPEGTANTRPEIYVMGTRNPFRFSIDSKTNYLYWGDVGPDAGANDSLRGPAGMGEYNQAREAGFFGWPYTRGNNQVYHDYDFARKQSKLPFDPTKIVNNSPNNTGIQNLPPVQESMIWYSYKKAPEFPWLGVGGVNPMSGPIYHADEYADSEYALPAYFDNKWFVYEWMRDWIYVVHLDENQRYVKADPFMPNTEFSHPMDMLFTKDGQFYILEYGQKWNSRNLDARLSLIKYNGGNRPPTPQFVADKEVGAAPLKVHLSAAASMDYDQDKLSYTWKLGAEERKSDSPELDYVFENPGVYDVELTVTDAQGEAASVNKKILVGNEPPQIKIDLSSDNNTYWKGKKMDYEIVVSDLEDGSTTNGTIDPAKIKVTFDYIAEGEDLILASIGHQQNTLPKGLELINASDCKACHAIDKEVAGPSFEAIASRYEQKDKQQIIHRIIKGSNGIWGERMMAPHPQLKIEEVEEMVDYILSLDPQKKVEETVLPLAGRLDFNKHLEDEVAGKYVLMASYLDEGNPDVAGSSLSVVEKVVFIAPRLELENSLDLDKELGIWDSQGRTLVGSIKDGKNIKFSKISFDQLSSISIATAFNKNYAYAGQVEIRKGQVDGPLLGQVSVAFFDEDKEGTKVIEIDLDPAQGLDSLFLVFKNDQNKDQYVMNGDWIQLNYAKDRDI